jgi:hypothetical protein
MSKTIEEKEACVANILCEKIELARQKWPPPTECLHAVCLEHSVFVSRCPSTLYCIPYWTSYNTAKVDIDEVEYFLLGFQNKGIIRNLCPLSKEGYEYLQMNSRPIDD